MCGMAPTQLARYENGKAIPRRASLQRIARVLKVDGNWLLTGSSTTEGTANGSSAEESATELVVEISPENMALLRALEAITGKTRQELFQEMLRDLGAHLASHGGSVASFLDSLDDRVAALEHYLKKK